MKKIKLLTSLTSIGILGTSVPVIATSCNNSDKPTIRFSNVGMNCGIDHIDGQDCLFVNDYGHTYEDVQFVFSLSKDIADAEFEVKLGDEVLTVTKIMSEKLYYIVNIPKMTASFLPANKTGEKIIIKEKNNKVDQTTLIAFLGAAIVDVEGINDVTINAVMNPCEILYLKDKDEGTRTDGKFKLRLSRVPEAESESGSLEFSVIRFGDNKPYSSDITATFIDDHGVGYVEITISKSLPDTAEVSINDVLSIYCMNAKENVQPFTFKLEIQTNT